MMLMRVRSGRSGRRRGSQNPGTPAATSPVACATAGSAQMINAKAANPAKGAFRPIEPARGMLSSCPESQVFSQFGGRIRGASFDIERRDEPAVLVHQIDNGGVVH